MAIILKQSTIVSVKLGPFLDEDDGKTAEDGLTVPQSAVRLTKVGGAFAEKNSGTSAAHDEFGWYDVPLNATDTNTVGPLIAAIHGTGALPVWREFQVVEEDTYEFLMASGASPDTDVALILADTDELQQDDYPARFTTVDDYVQATLADTGTAGVVIASAQTVATVTTLTNHTPQSGDSFGLVQAILDDTGTSGVQIAGAQTVATVTTLTNHTPQSGDSFPLVGAILDDTGTSGVKIASAQTVATVTTLTNHTPQSGDSFPLVGAILDDTGTSGVLLSATATSGQLVDDVWDEAIEDHDTQGNAGWATALAVYAGPDGPGIYIDSGAANTNTVVGTDGTEINPISTFAAARTVADALGLKIYYLEGNSDITLAATHVDWEFIGIGSVSDNVVNLGSQDVSRSLFRNLTVEGIQGGASRITARDCALQDPGGGATTLHIFAERCGFVDEIEVDASNDNVFDQCFSLVAGTAAPVIIATGAAGTISVRHYSGGLEFESLSASHNVTWEGIGQVIFNANCNVNANVSVRGVGAITDNTAGMSSLTETSLVNMTKINTEADTALSDYDGPTEAEMDTAHALLATPAQVNAQVDLAFTTQMADSVATDGALPTREQAIYEIVQFLTERAVSGTTVTVKKVDGSTGLMTFTLDDGTDPTSITRAT